MAESQLPPQYNQVYSLGVQPGIKRDGTIFESREYSDGVWCRFQRGTPKKIGGYRQLFGSFGGIPRGMIANPYNGVNYVFVGNSVGIEVFTTGTSLGIGSGPFDAIIEPGYGTQTIASNTTTSFVINSISSPVTDFTDEFKPGDKVIFDGNISPVYTVTTSTFSTPNTTVNFTPALPALTVVSTASLYNEYYFPDARNLWQFDLQYSPSGGALKVLAHPGLNLENIDNGLATPLLFGNVLPNASYEWVFSILADTTGQNPTYQPISVSGGVCVLYPFIFVYGDNGYIANNHVDTSSYGDQTLTDWNGATANQVNMASTKVVKGTPVRGGTNSPSGLFWATDSLIRVSFTGAAPLYWRYDIISSQISIMSSSSIVEMDGVNFWMGVDRFYLYNGQVSVLPNDKNINWLFDNINFQQRQKAWATKVPRYNEIWFFYPRGGSTECNDVIIYNTKDKIWYDAGQALGSYRSCGYTTEIFPSPIWAGWEYNPSYSLPFVAIDYFSPLTPPSGTQVYIAGNVTPSFPPGSYLTQSNSPTARVLKVLTSQFIFTVDTESIGGVTLLTVDDFFDPTPAEGDFIYSVQNGYAIWQQEYGLDAVTLNDEQSIESSFTTCDISWVGGTPSQDTGSGVNRRMHLRRIEPDFVQTGNMTLNIIGDKFARGATELSGPFVFGPDTGKIDMRVEHREIRLKFTSNDLGGNYEMGRLLITAEYGDERP
jgi:hypothetical protein